MIFKNNKYTRKQYIIFLQMFYICVSIVIYYIIDRFLLLNIFYAYIDNYIVFLIMLYYSFNIT